MAMVRQLQHGGDATIVSQNDESYVNLLSEFQEARKYKYGYRLAQVPELELELETPPFVA